MIVAETERLRLRRLILDDAEFILELVNEPAWLRFIGDKGAHDLEGARRYLREGPLASYERFGIGIFAVERKGPGGENELVGTCGLLQREYLDDPDLGFAFLPRFWGKGYAYESAVAVLEWGRETLGHQRILALTDPDNAASIRLLEKLGFILERRIVVDESRGESNFFVLEGESGSRVAELLERTGFIGCGETSADFSTTYKKDPENE